MSSSRALAAEALGTALLVAAVVGSGIMAQRLTQDAALALFCNTLATGAMLVVLITIFAPISGAHFNPAVTLALALRGRIAAGAAALYVVAQFAGAIAGTLLAHAMFALPLLEAGTKARTGFGQWLAEAVAAFGLVLTIFGCKRDETVAWAIGLYIVAAYWFTSSTSFANPAVTVARALTASFAGIRPQDVCGFVAAQIAGALLAAGFAKWLFKSNAEARAR
jgi:glycerol uptake facilitator-like aquaporin